MEVALTVLNLDKNNIGDEGAAWLGEGFGVNSTLAYLGLSNDEGSMHG